VPEDIGSYFCDDKNICMVPEFKKKKIFIPAAMRISNHRYYYGDSFTLFYFYIM
jgi:hypothetical protein